MILIDEVSSLLPEGNKEYLDLKREIRFITAPEYFMDRDLLYPGCRLKWESPFLKRC